MVVITTARASTFFDIAENEWLPGLFSRSGSQAATLSTSPFRFEDELKADDEN